MVEILERKPISMYEAKRIIEKNKRDEERNYFEKITLEYLRPYTKEVKEEVVKEIIDKLVKDYGFPLETAIETVNCLPKTVSELIAITEKKVSLKLNEYSEILEFIKETIEAVSE